MTAQTLGARLRADAQQLFKSTQGSITPYAADEAWRAVLDIFHNRMRMDAATRTVAEHKDSSHFDLFEYKAALERLVSGEPIAYVLGEAWFLGRKFTVNSDVLVPRPDSEVLVEVALTTLRPIQAPRVLDVGTGSGCIAISIALECGNAQVVATDVSEGAINVARTNARQLGARNIEFMISDKYRALNEQRFDMIVSNPPYVASEDPHLQSLRFEPEIALVSGAEGLDMLRALISDAGKQLRPGGFLAVEHGFDQSEAVLHLFEKAGLNEIARYRDAGDHWRVVAGRAVAA